MTNQAKAVPIDIALKLNRSCPSIGCPADFVDSTQTLISAIVPSDGKPFSFLYEEGLPDWRKGQC